MPQRNLIILLASVALSYACYVRGEQNPYARFLATGMESIDGSALEQVPDRELFDGAMRGMVDVLREHGDEHSQFLNQEEADPLRDEIRQQFGGIGVRIRLVGDPPRLVLAGPPEPGSPAARANLLPGDQILEIDGRSTSDMSMASVLHLMRGQPGSKLRLTIEQAHDAGTRTVELIREIITIESIQGDAHDRDGKWQFALTSDPRIALVRITSFGDRTAEELASVLERETARGVKAVVLDLRDNAGGSLDAAIAVCDMLLPAEKTVVETRGRNGAVRHRYTTSSGDPRFLSLPVAVLVNQNSASAAEIVAACLQDHGRAVVVGQRTFGKGTVQQLLPMEAGKSLLKLTWASFWRPSKANIHRAMKATEDDKWGVSPNDGFDVRLSPEAYAVYRRWRFERDMLGQDDPENLKDLADPDEPPVPDDYVDAALAKAVEHLQGQLAAAAE